MEAKLNRVSDWRDDWPEPVKQDCRGCQKPTTATVDGYIAGASVQVPMCFACWVSLLAEPLVSTTKGDAGS